MKESKEPRIETISILNSLEGFGIEVLFCTIARKAYFSVAVVDYILRKKAAVTASEKLDSKVEIKEEYCTYSGEEFTATLVKHPYKYHLVLSAPGLILPSGATGIKAELSLPLFESNTFTYNDDNDLRLKLMTPVTAEGMLIIDHKRIPVSQETSYGVFCSATGNLRNREITSSCCTLKDVPGTLWGYISTDDKGMLMRAEESISAKLTEEPLFEISGQISKGTVSFSYSRFSGSFTSGDGLKHTVQPSYGVRTTFTV